MGVDGLHQGTVQRDAFVGRRRELDQIRLTHPRAYKDSPVVKSVLVSGIGGAGKTRLVREAFAPEQLIFVRCWPDAAPLWPWHSVLNELAVPIPPLSTDRFAHFKAVTDQLLSAAENQPLVIAIDDIHLADPLSLLLARFIIRATPTAPLSIVMTSRPLSTLAGEHRELVEFLRQDSDIIDLHGLGPNEIREFLASADFANGASDEEIEMIFALTDGNPLHLRTVVQAAVAHRSLPAGIDQAAKESAAHLDPQVALILQHAALLGPQPRVSDISALVPNTALQAVMAAIEKGSEVGLIASCEHGVVSFTHDLIRESLAASLPTEVRHIAHALAAQRFSLSTLDNERISAAASHAYAAWELFPTHHAETIMLLRESARSLRTLGAFETSAANLDRAAVVARSGFDQALLAEVLVERAEARLSCGHFREARAAFLEAALAAEHGENVSMLARAAIGLSGFWIHENRTPNEVSETNTIQRRALQRLGDKEPLLAYRLELRIATDEAYIDPNLMPRVDSLLNQIRQFDHPASLAEALSVVVQLLLSPHQEVARLDVLQEMLSAASQTRDPFMNLLAMCWRTSDLIMRNEPSVPQAIKELAERAETHRCDSVLFVARNMEVMQAIRAGTLDEAELLAEAAFTFGMQIGDRDTFGYYAAHLAAIRFFQGRDAELNGVIPAITEGNVLAVHDRGAEAGAALFALRAGDDALARLVMSKINHGDIPAPCTTWLLAMLATAEIAADLHDTEAAEILAAELSPFDGRLVIGHIGLICFGPISRTLARLAMVRGDVGAALGYLRRSLIEARNVSHRPAEALCLQQLGELLLERSDDADCSEGRQLIDQALTLARACAMTGHAIAWEASIARSETLSQSSAEGSTPYVVTFVRIDRRRWKVSGNGITIEVGNLVGMRQLHTLTNSPGEWISALALATDAPVRGLSTDRQDILDQKMMNDLRKRAEVLRQALDEPGLTMRRRDTLERELDATIETLRRAMGLGGKSRQFTSDAERARTAVTKAIRRAIAEVGVQSADLAGHLSASVETGTECRYAPISLTSFYRTA